MKLKDTCFLEEKLWPCKLVQLLQRTVWRFLKKLQLQLPYDPAIPLMGIHTEETRIERDTCTPMFIAALFIIARTWKQPRCPSADEWIRKLWYIYTRECSVQFSSVQLLSRIWLFAIPWIAACQASPSITNSRSSLREYYSAIKKNTFESVLMRWMKLEPIIEWSKSERKTLIKHSNAYRWNLERW